jgi:hypothetical protein
MRVAGVVGRRNARRYWPNPAASAGTTRLFVIEDAIQAVEFNEYA